MPLSNEDSLRLNVLCAQAVKAIRINESSMLLTALTDKGEARIELNPNERHEAYLRKVRTFLSEKYLGMPGGYPRHLGRWTRMGDSRNSLDKMLVLGEPEAIIALAYSSPISPELAGYAWWAYQSELISDKHKTALWERAKRKNPYFAGFLLAGPQSIPYTETEHHDFTAASSKLGEELSTSNPFAQTYLHFLSSDGQKWLKSLRLALKKPGDPDVVIALFIAIDQYVDLGIGEHRGVRQIQQALESTNTLCSSEDAPAQLRKVHDKLDAQQRARFKALLVLAQLGENTLNKIFGGRDATGTVMRKHLQPLTTQINKTINTLLS